jgi:group I intron endonuclease
MINNLNNLNLTPVAFYENIYISRLKIFKENKGKSGVYCFSNNINNKFYIGSSRYLNARFSTYFSEIELERRLNRSSSAIYSAILKYGYSNFNLYILEYCKPNALIEREQYYIDLLDPTYNILKRASSRLGSKHSLETLNKLRGRKHSHETIIRIREAMKNRIPTSELRKINQLLATGHRTTVINIIDNTVKVFDSIHLAANHLNVSYGTLYSYVNKNKIFKNIFLITKNK